MGIFKDGTIEFGEDKTMGSFFMEKPKYNEDGSLVVEKPGLRNIDLSEVSKVVDTVKPIDQISKRGKINKVYHGEKIVVIQNHKGIIITVWRKGETK